MPRRLCHLGGALPGCSLATILREEAEPNRTDRSLSHCFRSKCFAIQVEWQR
jgi:hypothetical protein